METVQFQSYVFTYSVYGGILIGILYDIYRVVRGRKRSEHLISSFWDLFFLLSVLLVVVWAVFSSNYGDIRAYVLIGFLVGFYLYEKLLGRIAVGLFQLMKRKLLQYIKTTGSIAVLPLRFVFNQASRGRVRLLKYAGKKKNRLRSLGKLPKQILNDTKKYYGLIIKRQNKGQR